MLSCCIEDACDGFSGVGNYHFVVFQTRLGSLTGVSADSNVSISKVTYNMNNTHDPIHGRIQCVTVLQSWQHDRIKLSRSLSILENLIKPRLCVPYRAANIESALEEDINNMTPNVTVGSGHEDPWADWKSKLIKTRHFCVESFDKDVY